MQGNHNPLLYGLRRRRWWLIPQIQDPDPLFDPVNRGDQVVGGGEVSHEFFEARGDTTPNLDTTDEALGLILTPIDAPCPPGVYGRVALAGKPIAEVAAR